MKIIVIGTGYVGLVTGACLSDIGVEVIGIDIDEDKIAKLRQGIMPIYEPALEEMVNRNMEKGRLRFDVSLAPHMEDVDVIFIAVGTPENEDGSADIQYVLEAARQIGTHLQGYAVIVNKSTVPVGSASRVKAEIQAALQIRGREHAFDVASNPEFLKEGTAVQDFMSPDRIVIGVDSEQAKKVMEQVYKPFLLNGFRILFMDIRSAEMTKYAANAMLATRISFMNEVANLCEKLGADINQVRIGMGSDQRIGKKFLYPGIGYGGSCFPKDVKALRKMGEDFGSPLHILEKVEAVNTTQKMLLFHKLRHLCGEDLSGMKVAVWGLSFKPQTDDVREAASLLVIPALLEAGAEVRAYDPVAMKGAAAKLPEEVLMTANEYDALKGADALLLLTEWREFRLPDWDKIKRLMRRALILDGRNIYNREELDQLGIEYHCIGVGRQTVPDSPTILTVKD